MADWFPEGSVSVYTHVSRSHPTNYFVCINGYYLGSFLPSLDVGTGMGLAQVRPVIAANETGSASNVPFVYHDQMLTKAKSIEFCSDAEVMTWNPFCPYI